jgi:hypothetical protein
VKYPAKASDAEMILAEEFIPKRLRLSPYSATEKLVIDYRNLSIERGQ